MARSVTIIAYSIFLLDYLRTARCFYARLSIFLLRDFSSAVSLYVPLRAVYRFRSVLPILLEVRRWSGGGSWWVTLPRWSTGARARCAAHRRTLTTVGCRRNRRCHRRRRHRRRRRHHPAPSTWVHQFILPPPPPVRRRRRSRTPYQTSGSINASGLSSFPTKNDCLPHYCGPLLMFFLLFLLLLYLLHFSSFFIFLALSPSLLSSLFVGSLGLDLLPPTFFSRFLLPLSHLVLSSFVFCDFLSILSLLFFFDDARLLIFSFSVSLSFVFFGCLLYSLPRDSDILFSSFYSLAASASPCMRISSVIPTYVARLRHSPLLARSMLPSFEFDILPDPSCIKHTD